MNQDRLQMLKDAHTRALIKAGKTEECTVDEKIDTLETLDSNETCEGIGMNNVLKILQE